MKKFATLIVAVGLCVAVAQGQAVKKIKEVIASGATDAKNAAGTMHLWGTIGQSVIGPTWNNGNVDFQGFWHVPSKPSAVEVIHTGLPGDFQLFQNYPNPFNPATTIKFTVPSFSHIVLRVVSMTGAVVKTLVDENYSAGEYSVVFTANEIPTGTYLYTLTAGNRVMTKRMILIK